MDAGNDGFIKDSYRDELDEPRHIRFSIWYHLGSIIECAETPFLQWDIVQLLKYINTVMQAQQSSLIWVTTEKGFQGKSDIGEDY